MAPNIEFHPDVANDLRELKINPVQLSQIRSTVIAESKDLDSYTSRIRGLPQQFRKLKFNGLRIVLWSSKSTVNVLRIFHRRQGYSKESLERLIRLVREYTG
ncbi:hypothetical protein HYV82_06585 [Candidatus Woesearchaeota archaeon]|nr:hypothetical protein [Candidatus Woesearchaeota archaeon]